jgi:hypothetical protein
MGPNQPPSYSQGMGALSFRKKWSGHKAELSLASSAEVKNEWSHTSKTHRLSWRLERKITCCIFITSSLLGK